MNTTIWIKQLIELIGEIDRANGVAKNVDLVGLLGIWYDNFTIEEKEKLFLALEKEFQTDYDIYIYLLSLIIYITKDILITNILIDYIIKKNLSLYNSLYYETQLLKATCIYQKRRELHRYNMQKLQELFLKHANKISLDERNKKNIVIVTEQLLGIQHSPSKIVLDIIYYLQKVHKYQVHLFVCPTSIYHSKETWYNCFYFNYIEEFNGRIKLVYKDIKIDYCQIPLNQENYNIINQEINYIRSLKPYFIYSLGCSNAIADMFSKITTVVAQSMDVELPCNEAQILLKLWNDNDKYSSFEYYLTKNQRLIPYQFIYVFENSGIEMSRKELDLPEDQYLIAIVGNRLDDEINKVFAADIRTIINKNDSVSIVFVGDFYKCNDFFGDLVDENRVYLLEYQNSLLSAYPCFNLYWNPPRKGGGVSALMALKSGIPVVTLPECDVAYHVGSDFIYHNEEEQLDIINRYIHEEELNVIMKQKSYERFEKLAENYNNNLQELIRNIDKTIYELEVEG